MTKSKLGTFLLVSLVTVLGALRSAQAADPKPVLVVSLSSSDRFMEDIDTVTKSIGMPELGAVAKFFAQQYTQLLSPNQPLGVYVEVADAQSEPDVVAFLSAPNFNSIRGKLEEQLDEPQDTGDGILKYPRNKPLFVRNVGGWVFFGNKRDNLLQVPKQPAAMLGDMPKTYAVAVRVQPQNLSDELRQRAIDELEKGFAQAQQQLGNEGNDETQKQLQKNALDNMKMLVRETESVTIGFGVDKESQSTYLDFNVIALPNTQMAEQFALAKQVTTGFSGFGLINSAIAGSIASKIAKRDQSQLKEMINQARRKASEEIDNDKNLKTADDRAIAKEVVTTLLDVAQATLEAGKVDGAGTLILEPESLTVIGGAHVVSADRLDGALRKFVELAKRDTKFPAIKFNADKVGDVQLHTLNIPLPEGEEEARKLLGERFDVVIGIGSKSAYFGVGRNCLDVLKTAISKSQTAGEQATIPVKVTISLASILRFAKSVEDKPELEALINAAQRIPGRDHINLTQKAIDRGATGRFEIEEGVLQVIGQAIKQRNAQN